MKRGAWATLMPGVLMLVAMTVACNTDERVLGPDGSGVTGPLESPGPKKPPGEEALDRMTGGGKLGEGRDFATFGFQVRPGQGNFQWQQHCLDGVNASSTCTFGGFSFHGSTILSYTVVPEDPEHCRSWIGTGVVKLRDPALAAQYNGTYEYRVDKACDYGEPGHGTDYISFTLASYHREAFLTGGNLQLHKAQKHGPQAVTMEVTEP